MTNLQILSALQNNGGSMDYVALLNLNITDTNRDTLADKERIEQMIGQGLLEGRTNAFGHISITNSGRLFLQDAYYLEEQDKKHAEDLACEKAEQKKETRFMRITTLVSLVIAALAVLIAFIELMVK